MKPDWITPDQTAYKYSKTLINYWSVKENVNVLTQSENYRNLFKQEWTQTNKHSGFIFHPPEAEVEAVVRYHLHRLITGSNDVRTDGRNNVTFEHASIN